MCKKKYMIAGAAVAASVAGAVVVVSAARKRKYAKAYNDGARIAAKSCGVPYYSNVFLVITSDKLTPVQLRELTVLTGGAVEKSEKTDAGVYTTFLLPERHSLRDLDDLGQDIGSACDYVNFAGYLGAEED